MPIYTYRCEHCGIQFDKTQKFSDPMLTKCPECGKKSLKKVYTPVGIVFKGSGFYATDHRSPSGAKHGTTHQNEETKPESKTETKVEGSSSPAASTEPSTAKETTATATSEKD